jgi:hypothetical protein
MDPAYPRPADGAIVNRRFTMQRLRPVAAVAMLVGLVAACGEGTVDTTTPPSTTTTLATTTTTEAEPTSTTAPAVLSGPLLVTNPTGWDGNLVRLTTLDGTAVAELATDRHWPWVELITGDGSGGLLAVASPPPFPAGAVIRLASGSLEPELAYVPDEGWRVLAIDTLTGKDRTMTLVITEGRWDERREGDVDPIDVSEWWARTRLVTPDGATITAVEATGRTQVRSDMEYTSSGDPWIAHVTAGGGLLAVRRHASEAHCSWLEVFDAAGEPIELAVNPAPRGACRVLERVELSDDGRYVVLRDDEAVVVHRLEDGAEVGRIGGAWDHLFDGDRTILARTGDDRIVVATISDSGLEVDQLDLDPMQEWPMTLLAGVTLDPQASWTVPGAPVTCSAGGMDPALPPIDALPPLVEATRRRIAELAVACDFAGLAELAARDSAFVLYEVHACGDPSPTIADLDPVGRWYAADLVKAKLRVLVEALSGAPELTDSWEGAVGRAYVWRGPGYLTGITSDGTWRIDSVSPAEPCETIWCTC